MENQGLYDSQGLAPRDPRMSGPGATQHDIMLLVEEVGYTS